MSTTSTKAGDLFPEAATPSGQTLRGLPYVAIDPQWLLESEAFNSGVDGLAAAAVRMLFTAWNNTPAGSLPSDYRGLARAAGLPEAVLVDHYDTLLAGWELREGRMCHIGMTALAVRLGQRYGDALQEICDRSAAAVQDPELFELVPPVAKEPPRTTRGRRVLPADFALTDKLRQELVEKAKITDEGDQQYVFDKFVSHARTDNVMHIRWDQAFVNFAMKERPWQLPSRQQVPLRRSGGVTPQSLARWGSAGTAATEHNREMVRRVLEPTGGRAA